MYRFFKVMVEVRAEPTDGGKPLSIRGYIDRDAELKVISKNLK